MTVVRAADSDDTVRFRNARQRTKENDVDQAEDRAVGANTQSESEHCSGGECRSASKEAHGVPEILKEAIHTDIRQGLSSPHS